MANKIPIGKYIENIKINGGRAQTDLKKMAIAKGYFKSVKLKQSVKRGEVIARHKKISI